MDHTPLIASADKSKSPPRGVQLDQVVPWGRSFDEYSAMFDLRAIDFSRGRSILGCGDGPASFNAEAWERFPDCRVVSCDPIYLHSPEMIRTRVGETFGPMLEQVRSRPEHFVWSGTIRSPAHLGKLRLGAMERFLGHLSQERARTRYVAASLPALPFADGSFDLALCSHLLFLYTQQLDRAFHVASMRELCRIAREVRVFPLLDLNGEPSRHLNAVRDALLSTHRIDERCVGYEFLRGARAMLVVSKR